MAANRACKRLVGKLCFSGGTTCRASGRLLKNDRRCGGDGDVMVLVLAVEILFAAAAAVVVSAVVVVRAGISLLLRRIE